MDADLLKGFGIYSFRDALPEGFDINLSRPVKDGEPVIDHEAGEVVQHYRAEPMPDEVLKIRLREEAESVRKAALASADNAVAAYMALFSDVERATWPTQQAEVNAYLADDSAPTPTLDGLAQARGISREDMLQKAIAKIKAFEPLSVMIVGRQQSYEDIIAATVANEERTLTQRITALRNLEFDYSDIMAMAAGA